jgi:hypothetical protein
MKNILDRNQNGVCNPLYVYLYTKENMVMRPGSNLCQETKSVTEHVRVACGMKVYFQRPFENTIFFFFAFVFYFKVALH